jgi:anti-sigma regulatory factor (Ser/Thr protein kinase)
MPGPDREHQPAQANEVVAGREMNFPYPARALGISFLTLAAVPSAAGCSRQLVRLTLTRWGLRRLTDDAELVVSELATNAIQATGVMDTDARWGDLGDLATIHVRVLLFGSSVVLEVWDGDPAAPVPQQATDEEEGGRGLSIVTMLAARWSWLPAPQGGKVVWAELPIPPHPRTAADLPQRSRPALTAGNRDRVVGDRGLLGRIRQGLENL